MSLISKYRFWILIIIIFSSLTMGIELRFDRLNLVDFEVYHRTATRMLSGNSIYRVEGDGFYVYKYAPTAAIFFMPLSLLPFAYAKFVYWIISTIVIILCFHFAFNLFVTSRSVLKENYLIPLAFAVFGTHFHLELGLGQVNLILLLLFLLIIKFYREKKFLYLSVLLAISIYIKPLGLIFFPFFLIKKEFGVLFKTIIFMFVLGLLPFVFYPSAELFSSLYNNWISELTIEMNKKQRLLADTNHTIFSVLARHTPIRFLMIGPIAEKIYQFIVLGSIGLFVLWIMKIEKNFKKDNLISMATLCCLIPMLAATNSNAFIFVLPLFILLIDRFNRFSFLEKTLLFVSGILIGGNIYDIFGKELHTLFDQLSIVGIGAIVVFIFSYRLIILEKKSITVKA